MRLPEANAGFSEATRGARVALCPLPRSALRRFAGPRLRAVLRERRARSCRHDATAARSASRCAAAAMAAIVSSRRMATAAFEREYCLIWLNAASTIPGNVIGARDDPQPILLVVAIGRGHVAPGQAAQRGAQAVHARDRRERVVYAGRERARRDLDELVDGELDILRVGALVAEHEGGIHLRPRARR